MADTGPQTIAVETPFLAIEARAAVFDVTVTQTATEVSVERGQVRIATPDGRRQIELEAGESAYAGGPGGDGLAFRRGPGEPLEAVEPTILPAMRHKAGIGEGRPVAAPLTLEVGAANRSGTAASEATVPIATAVRAVTSRDRAAAVPARRAERSAGLVGDPNSAAVSGDAIEAPAPVTEPNPADAAEVDHPPLGTATARPTTGPHPTADHPTEKRGSSYRRSLFDRLTEGMVDTVPAPRPSEEQPTDAHSI